MPVYEIVIDFRSRTWSWPLLAAVCRMKCIKYVTLLPQAMTNKKYTADILFSLRPFLTFSRLDAENRMLTPF